MLCNSTEILNVKKEAFAEYPGSTNVIAFTSRSKWNFIKYPKIPKKGLFQKILTEK